MHVVHVTGAYVPGLGYEENCLPLEQAKAGHDVTIVTSNRRLSTLRWIRSEHGRTADDHSAQEPHNIPNLSIVRLTGLPEVYGQIALLGLGRCLAELKPDVVHTHGAFTPSTLQCLWAQNRNGFRLFVDDHSHALNLHVDSMPKRLYIELVRAIYKLFMERVDAFLPVTSAADSVLERVLAIPQARRFPVTLGVDTSLFLRSLAERTKWRSDSSFGSNDVVVMWAGRIQEQKSLEPLLRAFQQCEVGRSALHLVLVGSGDPVYVEELERLARELGLRHRIHFFGFAPHVGLPALYSGADIGVWPGPPSITVLEALSAGLPTILPADEPAYDKIRAHNACVEFDKHSVTSLTSAIDTLANNPALRDLLSARARRCMEEHFAWPLVAKRILALYQLHAFDRQVRQTLG